MPYLSIQQASEELRSGLITPTELLAETLERIDQLDSDIQAYVTVLHDQAYEEAEKAENEQRTGLFRSPLHGIPIAIKDLIAVRIRRTWRKGDVIEVHSYQATGGSGRDASERHIALPWPSRAADT